MGGNARVVGIILIVIGVIVAVVAGVWLLAGISDEQVTQSGAILGFAIALVIVLPLLAIGVYLTIRGGREAQELAEVRKQRRILEMVTTQGKAPISDVALELGASRDQVKNYIYDLVGKGLFSGYIRWDEGVLYSREASQLKTNKCPNCGGQIELAGKGIVRCPFCGTEIFLS